MLNDAEQYFYVRNAQGDILDMIQRLDITTYNQDIIILSGEDS